jgi:hypothetical protein
MESGWALDRCYVVTRRETRESWTVRAKVDGALGCHGQPVALDSSRSGEFERQQDLNKIVFIAMLLLEHAGRVGLISIMTLSFGWWSYGTYR